MGNCFLRIVYAIINNHLSKEFHGNRKKTGFDDHGKTKRLFPQRFSEKAWFSGFLGSDRIGLNERTTLDKPAAEPAGSCKLVVGNHIAVNDEGTNVFSQ